MEKLHSVRSARQHLNQARETEKSVRKSSLAIPINSTPFLTFRKFEFFISNAYNILASSPTFFFAVVVVLQFLRFLSFKMASIRRTLFPSTPNSDTERCTDNSLSVLSCSEVSESSNTEKECGNGDSEEFQDVVLEENTVN